MPIECFMFRLGEIFSSDQRREDFLTPASGHGNLNKFTAPLSSPVTIVVDVACAQLI